MAKFLVQNGVPLYGVVQISGAKNAVLPEMASAILTKEKCKISDVPNLIDVKVMKEILVSLGGSINQIEENVLEINMEELTKREAS